MGKFGNLDSSIYSIFADSTWTDENISVYPENFSASTAETQFVRLNIIPAGEGINVRSVSGVLLAEIFVPKEKTSIPISIVADALDRFLAGKTLEASTGSVQFFGSSIGNKRLDSSNPALYRAEYSINFTYNEVIV